MWKLFSVLISVLLLGQIVQAQEPAVVTDSTAFILDEVVVTAQRSRQEQTRVPYSVSVLTLSSLQEMVPRSTPEALMSSPGVFVQKTNHGGGSPFIRGVTGNQTLLLLDGIRLNNSTFRYGPNQYLNTVDMYSIQRIEVARGTGSVQYGTDAIGGVIQVFTREPEFKEGKPALHGQVLGKFISDGMEKTGRGDLQYSGKKLAVTGGVSWKDFGDLKGGDTTGFQTPSGYREQAFDLKMKYKLKANQFLYLAGQMLRQEDVPVYHKVRLENFLTNKMDPQQRILAYARYKSVKGNRLFNETELTLSFQENSEGRISQKNGSNQLRTEKDRVRTAGITGEIRSAFAKQWTATTGIECYIDKVNSSRQDLNTDTRIPVAKRGLYPDRSLYGNYSVYTLHRFSRGKWLLDAGLRFNQFSVKIADTTLGNVQINPSALVGNAALLFAISRQQSLYISYSSGYRAPNVDDMGTLGIVDFRYELPAADLRPEKSAHTELGYKINKPGFSASAALFYAHLSNLITRVREEGQVISGYPVYRKENTEAAFLRGAECSFTIRPLTAIQLQGAIAYTFGQNLTRHEPLRRVPPFNGRLMTRYKMNKLFAAAEWQFATTQHRLAQGDKEDNRIPAGGTPGWSVFNLYGGYTKRHIAITACFQNLFNKDYRTHGSGINGIGRSAWISLAFHF